MLRQIVAAWLVMALALPAQEVPKATPQEKILSVPVGTVVVVKTMAKETFRGRLGEATTTGFTLQVARREKVETVQVAFADLKSVRVVKKADTSDGRGVGRAVGWMVLGGLAAVGTIALIGLVYRN